MRTIFHVDMDSFFASCEILRRPELKNEPVIIGGKSERGVVSTANYKAREFGVKSAMSIVRAKELCPEGVYLPPDMKYYKSLSLKIMNILNGFADKFEPISIDEAYLDVTDKLDNISPMILAAKIKKEIYNQTKLTCSIGIAHNKSIAKIASDFEKPNGVTYVKYDEARDFLKDMPIRKISGVGKVTEQQLINLGIKLIGDLASKDRQWVIEKLGKSSLRLWLIANALESSDVAPRESSESYSTEKTFDEDIDDKDLIFEYFKKMCRRVSNELKEDKYLAKTISIKIRYDDFETITRAKTLPFHFNDYKTIFDETLFLFDENYDVSRKIRLVGVKCSNLQQSVEKQTKITDFFDL
ncbi:DNA polymerase IV [Candidatus Woesearchaeota archaeon]|nr:MAG: DNA polymerase IV [Candidatus Woesearchaeota archaeon]